MTDQQTPDLWATSADVLRLWVGDRKPTNSDQVDAFCEIAQSIVVGEFPDIEQRIANDPALRVRAKFVVIQQVAGIYKNPENLRYFQESTGPWLRAGNVADQLLKQMTLTDDQRRQLAPVKKRRGGMTDMDPSPGRVIGDPLFIEQYFWTL